MEPPPNEQLRRDKLDSQFIVTPILHAGGWLLPCAHAQRSKVIGCVVVVVVITKIARYRVLGVCASAS